jgi:hypothetical protein
MPGEQVDVFISYCGRDSQWARWIDFVLREAGYWTTVQLYDFVPGESFVREVQNALTKSRYVANLLSPGYLASWWCEEEWQAALCRHNLFPIRIEMCKPEGLLANKIYIDLADVTEAEEEQGHVRAACFFLEIRCGDRAVLAKSYWCAGDCRGEAVATTGDPLAASPYCTDLRQCLTELFWLQSGSARSWNGRP